MALKSGLLVINHVMDDSDPYLSHQAEVVRLLAEKFQEICVITGRIGNHSAPPNVRVISSHWVPGHGFRNLIRFICVIAPKLFSREHKVIFSHMADLQAAVIAPFVRLVGKRHFLWYAHSYKSVYLSWASIWINGVISSTGGSCPIQNGKVTLIGQSVNPKMFPARDSTKLNKNLLVHVGRLDRSKNIDLLIQATISIQKLNSGARLTLIGSSANVESSDYLSELTTSYGLEIDAGTVSFIPSIPREKLSAALREFDIFIHAYEGSLDKTLIEATFSLMPVITINPEYASIFGTWSNLPSPTLYQEYLALNAMSNSEISKQLHRRFNIAKSSHSSDQWIQKLSEILAPSSDYKARTRTEGAL